MKKFFQNLKATFKTKMKYLWLGLTASSKGGYAVTSNRPAISSEDRFVDPGVRHAGSNYYEDFGPSHEDD